MKCKNCKDQIEKEEEAFIHGKKVCQRCYFKERSSGRGRPHFKSGDWLKALYARGNTSK